MLIGGPKTHKLKSCLACFDKIWRGKMRFEWRLNDRNYKPGDKLEIREWNEKKGRYTGRIVFCEVLFVLLGGTLGMPSNYCIMTIDKPKPVTISDKDPHQAILDSDKIIKVVR